MEKFTTLTGVAAPMDMINIDTDIRLAITSAIRETMANDPAEFDPRKYMKPAMAAVTKLCVEKFDSFGTAGHAERIRALPLDKMATLYRAA